MFKYFLFSLNLNNIFKVLLFIFIVSVPFKNVIYQISVVSLIVLFFYSVIKRDTSELKSFYILYKDIIFIISSVLILMITSNLLNIDNIFHSTRELLSFMYKFVLLFFVLLYFYFINFFKRAEILNFILISIFLQLLLGIYQVFFEFNILENINNLSRGISGVTFNRNQFGLLMGIGFLTTLIFFRHKLIKLLIPFFLLAIIFSYTRAVWISIFICLIVWVLINIKNLTIKNIIFVVFITVIIILIGLNTEFVSNRFEQLLSGHSSGRFEIWTHTLNLIKDNLIFGYGLDAWNIHKLRHYTNIHNSILEILFTLGILGFVIFSYITFLLLKEIKLNKSYDLLIMVVYFMIISQFGNSIFYSKIFLSFLSLFVLLIYSKRKDNIYIKEAIK